MKSKCSKYHPVIPHEDQLSTFLLLDCGLRIVFVSLSPTTSNFKSLGVTLNTDFKTGTHVQESRHKDYGYEVIERE